MIAARAKPAVQKRSEAKREAIVQAAMDLLAERDMGEIAIGDIAHRAGVAVGTVYQRFENKQALVAHLLHTRQERQVEELAVFLGPDRWAGEGVVTRVRWLRERLVASDKAAPGLLRAILSYVVSGRDTLADVARAREVETLDLLAEWLIAGAPASPDVERKARVTVALATFVHAVHIAALYPFSYAGLPRETVLDELEAALLAQLERLLPCD